MVARLVIYSFISLALWLLSLAAAIAQIDTAEVQRVAVQPFILDSIAIRTHDVFEGVSPIALVGGLLDHLHALTKERAIRNEIFFEPGDTVRQTDLDELEQNLRRLAIFSDITITVLPGVKREYEEEDEDEEYEDEEEFPHGIVMVRTRDAFSLRLSFNYSTTEDVLSYFVSLHEVNFLGLAKQFGGSVSYTDFNNRGFKYTLDYLNPNIFGTHVYLGGNFGFAKDERSGSFYVGRPFFSDRTPYGFNTGYGYYRGAETFDFRLPSAEVFSRTARLEQSVLGGWYSISRGEIGNVFRAAVSVNYNRTLRDSLPGVHRAFENSVSVFGGISSRKRVYTRIVNADFEGEQQVPIGGMGSVSIGKISPHHGGLDNVVYVGGDARQGVRHGDFYGFASIEAGTGLSGQQSVFTTQRVSARGAWVMNPGALVARFEESTVWNWPRYLFLPLDHGTGLRGYSRLDNFGDNKMFLNLEYRLFPILRILWFDIGATAFYDVGSAWRQSEKIGDVRFHSSAGLGLRFSNAKAKIDKGLLRVDFAYNFDEKRIARIILSSQEAFDFFGTLDFRPPAPYIY